MNFDERLEEGHAEHFAFALVDTRGEEVVNVVAEQVPFQERSSAVRLHEQLDGRFFLRFAAEDLGDDAFHFAAIAFVEQPRAPVGQRVAGNDQTGHVPDAALHKLAGVDLRSVRRSELPPRQHIFEHDAHRAGGSGNKCNAASVEAVVRDGQPVASTGVEKIRGGNSEVVELQAVVPRMLQGIDPVWHHLKLLVLFLGKIGDQY